MSHPPLSILHVAEDVSAAAGGVPAVVRQLTRRSHRAGSRMSVLHVHGDGSDLSSCAQVIPAPPSAMGRPWAFSRLLLQAVSAALLRLRDDGGVAHVHGVWCAPQFATCLMAARDGVPSVLTVHGMMEPWLWNEQGPLIHWKKRLYWRFAGASSLRRATAIHAITPLEQNHLRALFPRNEIVVIPNAVELDDEDSRSLAPSPVRVILFLGRLEPKKGVDILINAFAASGLSRDWLLQIAGPAWSPRYAEQLTRIAAASGMRDRIQFLGPVAGAEKARLLANAWVLVAPSHSEVAGLVNLEAAARGLPSITTFETGLYDWQDGGGMLVHPTVDAVAAALIAAARWDDSERRERGIQSRALVARRYSWEAVMPLWLQLYSHLRAQSI